jgi:hypothetical protein
MSTTWRIRLAVAIQKSRPRSERTDAGFRDKRNRRGTENVQRTDPQDITSCEAIIVRGHPYARVRTHRSTSSATDSQVFPDAFQGQTSYLSLLASDSAANWNQHFADRQFSVGRQPEHDPATEAESVRKECGSHARWSYLSGGFDSGCPCGWSSDFGAPHRTQEGRSSTSSSGITNCRRQAWQNITTVALVVGSSLMGAHPDWPWWLRCESCKNVVHVSVWDNRTRTACRNKSAKRRGGSVAFAANAGVTFKLP